MRTPLNAVLGFAQLMQMEAAATSPKMHAYATQIHVAGGHMLSLVNDLLDLGSAVQGQLQFKLESVSLTEVLAQAMAMVDGDVRARGVSTRLQMSEGLRVHAEPRRLRQVLLNVLSNAIKYNRRGGQVTLTAQRASALGRVQLLVEDSGIGMSAEQLERLFQPFERVGAEYSTVRGAGLGLVIARSLAEAMGGTLVITSTPNQGSCVTVELASA
jgi:signal transduction histidine kinase